MLSCIEAFLAIYSIYHHNDIYGDIIACYLTRMFVSDKETIPHYQSQVIAEFIYTPHVPLLHSLNNVSVKFLLAYVYIDLSESTFLTRYLHRLYTYTLHTYCTMYVVRIILASLVTTARAHMSLWYPPPLGGNREANSFTIQVDKEFNFPIGCCNSQGEPTLPSPGDCRGHLALLDTEEGRPQVTWEPGQDAYFKLSDHMYSIGVPGSTHYGGSCQIGFSVDKGQTWKVAASYHGNCPHRDKDMPQVFEFKVPLNIPTGIAVFAWIWLNREHEFFMNCAAVQISLGSSSTTTRTYTSFEAVPTTRSAALLNPSSESIRGGEQDRSNGCDEDSIACSSSYGAKLARSEWKYIKHRHSRKHSKQNYHIHKSNVLAPPKKFHRRSENPASDVCDWNTAPRMETSYYSVDAQCAPNAKLKNLESDDFEIGWSDACGVVEGDKVYTIQNIEC